MEHNFEGYPFAYFLLERNGPPLTRTKALIRLLVTVKGMGIHPETVLTDKDSSQIQAIGHVYGVKSVQLCYWHALRAVENNIITKISSPSESLKVRYANIDPFNDGRFNLTPSFPSVNDAGVGGEISSGLKDEILALFRVHFNSHPWIPSVRDHSFSSPEEIYIRSVNEMYDLTKENGLDALWMYLWVYWYSPHEWQLWAVSSNSRRIPYGRTTMFVESHWRILKQDYLRNNARPVSTLITSLTEFYFGIN